MVRLQLAVALSALCATFHGRAGVAASPLRGAGLPTEPLNRGLNVTEPFIEEYKRADGTLGIRAPISNAWNYGTQKVRGVNIGGWLVAEPWITPSLFDNTGDGRVIDEYTFGQYASNARGRLQQHWATWITQDDFRQIRAANLNHVRIPIGYWAFDTSAGEPYIRDAQFDYLKRAVGWARQYGLKVIVDLHGVPGSQNGFDNSGDKGDINWPNNYNNNVRAKNVLLTMAREFIDDQDTVTVIELVNEPFMVGGQQIRDFTTQYYRDSIGALRYDVSPSNFALAISDGFLGLEAWRNVFNPPQYEGILMDLHSYTVFSPAENAQNKQSRFNQICQKRSDIGNFQSALWTIVGEWTSATTDCAKYLNGRFVGARYDGSYPGSYYIGDCRTRTGDGSTFSDLYKQYLRQMFATQASVYQTGSGWVYWTWKTEYAADWDYQRQLQMGIIPYDLDNLQNVQC